MNKYCKDPCGTCDEEMLEARKEEKERRISEVKHLLNEICTWSKDPAFSGRFIGICFSEDDDYYILAGINGKYEYCSMVGNLTSLRSWEAYNDLEESYKYNGCNPVPELVIEEKVKIEDLIQCPYCQERFIPLESHKVFVKGQ